MKEQKLGRIWDQKKEMFLAIRGTLWTHPGYEEFTFIMVQKGKRWKIVEQSSGWSIQRGEPRTMEECNNGAILNLSGCTPEKLRGLILQAITNQGDRRREADGVKS